MKELPAGTPVTFEIKSHNKSEYVDAVITGYKDGKPCVQTFNKRQYDAVDPECVTADPVEDITEGGSFTDRLEELHQEILAARPWPEFPLQQPCHIL